MSGSLIFHPSVGALLWRSWLDASRQPIRRDFELPEIAIGAAPARLAWTSRALSPFASLTSAARTDRVADRKILLVPPLSGAFGFILRDVAAGLARTSRIHVLEWTNARFAPTSAGRFRITEQIQAVAHALGRIGPGAHLVALCQSGPAALIAAARLCAEARALGLAAPPLASLTLIAAPIRPGAAPSAFSRRFGPESLRMIERGAALRETPDGSLRRVLPAETHFTMLLSALAAQDPARDEFAALLLDSIEREEEAIGFKDFVTSYMDIALEFALDNVMRLYLAPMSLADAAFERGVACGAALDETPMLVIEGGRDQITAPGQTRAAFELARAGAAPRRALLIEEAGHFGLFYGSCWRRRVHPVLDAFLLDADARARAVAEAR